MLSLIIFFLVVFISVLAKFIPNKRAINEKAYLSGLYGWGILCFWSFFIVYFYITVLSIANPIMIYFREYPNFIIKDYPYVLFSMFIGLFFLLGLLIALTRSYIIDKKIYSKLSVGTYLIVSFTIIMIPIFLFILPFFSMVGNNQTASDVTDQIVFSFFSTILFLYIFYIVLNSLMKLFKAKKVIISAWLFLVVYIFIIAGVLWLPRWYAQYINYKEFQRTADKEYTLIFEPKGINKVFKAKVLGKYLAPIEKESDVFTSSRLINILDKNENVYFELTTNALSFTDAPKENQKLWTTTPLSTFNHTYADFMNLLNQNIEKGKVYRYSWEKHGQKVYLGCRAEDSKMLFCIYNKYMYETDSLYPQTKEKAWLLFYLRFFIDKNNPEELFKNVNKYQNLIKEEKR